MGKSRYRVKMVSINSYEMDWDDAWIHPVGDSGSLMTGYAVFKGDSSYKNRMVFFRLPKDEKEPFVIFGIDDIKNRELFMIELEIMMLKYILDWMADLELRYIEDWSSEKQQAFYGPDYDYEPIRPLDWNLSVEQISALPKRNIRDRI